MNSRRRISHASEPYGQQPTAARLCVGNDRRKLTRPRIGARCTDRASGAGGFKFTLADCHVGYRQKSLNGPALGVPDRVLNVAVSKDTLARTVCHGHWQGRSHRQARP
jgi:hypothetical protein